MQDTWTPERIIREVSKNPRLAADMWNVNNQIRNQYQKLMQQAQGLDQQSKKLAELNQELHNQLVYAHTFIYQLVKQTGDEVRISEQALLDVDLQKAYVSEEKDPVSHEVILRIEARKEDKAVTDGEKLPKELHDKPAEEPAT